MPKRFRMDDEDQQEPGMPGDNESRSIIDKIRGLVPDMEDIKQIAPRIVPQFNTYKQAALDQLSEMGNEFGTALDKAAQDYNKMTPEEQAMQAVNMVSGGGGIGTVGKLGNVLKTEIPLANTLRKKALEKLAQGSEGGFLSKYLPELQGIRKGTLEASHPTMQKMEQMMTAPEDMNMLKRLQSLKNQYGKF